MKGILADVNALGHLKRLVQIWQGDDWQDLWGLLDLAAHSFDDLNFRHDSSDAVIWRECQQRGLVLLTANRNDDGPDSLEATLRNHNTPDCLPVFTLADAERVLREGDYARRVAEKFLDYLMSIDNVRGSGRLYLP